MEQTVELLKGLPDRMAAVEVQLLHLRGRLLWRRSFGCPLGTLAALRLPTNGALPHLFLHLRSDARWKRGNYIE